jgi:hypothetical protein
MVQCEYKNRIRPSSNACNFENESVYGARRAVSRKSWETCLERSRLAPRRAVRVQTLCTSLRRPAANQKGSQCNSNAQILLTWSADCSTCFHKTETPLFRLLLRLSTTCRRNCPQESRAYYSARQRERCRSEAGADWGADLLKTLCSAAWALTRKSRTTLFYLSEEFFFTS